MNKKRGRRYGVAVAEALRVAWEATDRLCSNRLHPFLPELAATYHGLNPVTLLKQINENLEHLWNLAERPAHQRMLKKWKICLELSSDPSYHSSGKSRKEYSQC